MLSLSNSPLIRGAIPTLALALLALPGCEAFEGPYTPGDPGVVDPGTSETLTGGIVMGTVLTTSGSPLGDALVLINGEQTMSNGQGWFSLAGIDASTRAIGQATVDGYVSSHETFPIVDGQTTWVEFHLAPVEVTQMIDPATGGAVVSGTQTVTLPANGFVDAATGQPVTEPVEVSMSAFDYSDPGDYDAFPGDFVGLSADGVERPLESFGFVDVTLRTASGADVQLAPGATAELRLDSAVTATSPDQVPLWYYDTDRGIWVEDGMAVRDGTALVGSVDHFTSWNYDLSYDAVWLTGRVVDSVGFPLVNAHVQHRGVSYRGGSARHTDQEGRFRIPVNPDSDVEVWAVYRGERSDRMSVRTPPVDSELDIGDIIIGGIAGNVAASFVVRWGDSPSDLDSHLYTPSGAHISYSSRGSLAEPPYAYLNTDDTSSFGPEITSVTRLEAGTYEFCVHNFSGSPGLEASQAVITYSDSAGRINEVGAPTANPEGHLWWRVATFESDGNSVTALSFDGAYVASCGSVAPPVEDFQKEP